MGFSKSDTSFPPLSRTRLPSAALPHFRRQYPRIITSHQHPRAAQVCVLRVVVSRDAISAMDVAGSFGRALSRAIWRNRDFQSAAIWTRARFAVGQRFQRLFPFDGPTLLLGNDKPLLSMVYRFASLHRNMSFFSSDQFSTEPGAVYFLEIHKCPTLAARSPFDQPNGATSFFPESLS